MSATATNREGLAFEEWVLAATVAVFGYLHTDGVYPYSTSGPDLSESKSRRWRTVWYPRKVRKAWLNGEDPTEWRAELETKRNDERRKEADSNARRAGLG